MDRSKSFQVIVGQDEAGYYVAECPALKACYTQGKTYEEAIENIKDVINLCLEGRRRFRIALWSISALVSLGLFCVVPYAFEFSPVTAKLTKGDRYSALFWGGGGFNFQYRAAGRMYTVEDASFSATGPEGTAGGDMYRVDIYHNRWLPRWWRQFPPPYRMVFIARSVAGVSVITFGFLLLRELSRRSVRPTIEASLQTE